MKRAEFVALAGVVGVIALLVPAAGQGVFSKAREKANRTKCATNQKAVGLAAMMYADSRRWFPHVRERRVLDDGVDGNHTPKVFRALLWYGYADNPEQWVCPSSLDGTPEISDGDTKEQLRLWFWGGVHGKDAKLKTTSPFLYGDDPKLSETWELSYGWSRRTMKGASRSTLIVVADRASFAQGGEETSPLGGNHDDGWNVLNLGGEVEYIKTDYDPSDAGTSGFKTAAGWLAATTKGGGYLAIRPEEYEAQKVTKPAWAKKGRSADEDEDDKTEADADAGGCGQSCRLSSPGTFRGAGQGLALLLVVMALVVLRRRAP